MSLKLNYNLLLLIYLNEASLNLTYQLPSPPTGNEILLDLDDMEVACPEVSHGIYDVRTYKLLNKKCEGRKFNCSVKNSQVKAYFSLLLPMRKSPSQLNI